MYMYVCMYTLDLFLLILPGSRTPAYKHAGLVASTAIKSRRVVDDDDVASVSASVSALSTGKYLIRLLFLQVST